MGDLVGVRTDVPDSDDFDQLKREFGDFFQRDWAEVMVGAKEAFSFHRDWNTYLGVSGLRKYQVVLAGLTRKLREDGYRIYNTIFG